jgi:hypothetical protein
MRVRRWDLLTKRMTREKGSMRKIRVINASLSDGSNGDDSHEGSGIWASGPIVVRLSFDVKKI